MVMTFDLVTGFQQNLHFWKALIKIFRIMHHLNPFADVSISLMTPLRCYTVVL